MRNESELVFDHPSNHLEIAQVVKSYGVQIQVEQVRYAVCREYLWARLTSSEQRLDLLFKLETPPASPA